MDPLSTISATRPKVTHGHHHVIQPETIVAANESADDGGGTVPKTMREGFRGFWG